MQQIGKFEKVSFEQYLNDIGKNIECCDTEEDMISEINTIRDLYNDIQLPKRATTGSAGYDFYAPHSFDLDAGETILIPTGIRVHIEEGWWLGILPRSGLGFKYRLQLDNIFGVIDSDYFFSDNEGHIMIKLTNDSKSSKILTVEKGQGFAQGIFLPYGITSNDSTIETRNGGFGSTDK